MRERAWPWLVFVAMGAGLGWYVLAADEPIPPALHAPADAPRDPRAPIADDPGIGPVVSERVSIDGGWWVRNLSERGEEPLAPDAEDRFAPALRGRLTVRQRPWVHPANVEVRLTRSWLDSVLPVETGAQDQLAPAHDDVVAVTDADGWFTLRFRPQRGELFFLIDRDGVWMDFQKVPSLPRPGTTLELGDVWLEDRGGITGTVVDPWGRPVAGATMRAVDDPLLDAHAGLEGLRAARNQGLDQFRVPGSTAFGPLPDWVVRRDKFLPFPTATTDRSGSFRIRGLRHGAHDLYFVHDSGSATVADVQVAFGRETVIGRVQLRSNQAAPHLRFADEDGKPWVGAEVAFVHEDLGFGTPVVRTDARGAVHAILPDARCRIAFAFPAGGPWITLRASIDDRVIEVPRPPATTITLVDARGVLVRGARVRCYVVGGAFRPIDRALPSWMQPVEVAQGRHRGRLPCPVVGVAAAPGFAPAMTLIDEAEETMTMLPIETITVRTVDRHGSVVPGASVRIQAHDNPEYDWSGAQWSLLANDRVHVGRTDEQGLLTVPVWPTFLSLQADHPEFGPSPGQKLLPIPGQRVDLMLRRPAQVIGRLTFHQRPAAAGFRVRAQQKPPPGHVLETSGWLDEQVAVTGENGAFSFRGLDPGIWELRPELPSTPGVDGAREPGSDWKSLKVQVAEEQELHCTLEAEAEPMAARQLVGSVTMDGVALPGALVRLREFESRSAPPIEGYRSRRQRGRSSIEAAPAERLWSQRLTTDAFGDFGFGELRPDTEYELRVDVPWQDRLQFLARRVVRTKAHARDTARIDVTVPSCTLHLTCTDGGRGFGNRMLRLRQVAEDGSELARFETLTSVHGVCLAERLPAGTWLVEPVHGGRCEPAEFTIQPGATVSAAVEIRPY